MRLLSHVVDRDAIGEQSRTLEGGFDFFHGDAFFFHDRLGWSAGNETGGFFG